MLRILGGCLLSLFLSTISLAADEPVRIGMTLGLSGKYAALGQSQEMGYRLWEQHINASGGFIGRPVSLRILDDNSDPERAARLYASMISQDQVDLVFGPYSSAITQAVAPIAERHGFPLLAAGASADDIWSRGYRYVFGVYSPASRYAVGFLELALLQGLDSLAVVAADDSFSMSVYSGVLTWARRFGLHIVMTQLFEKGSDPYEEIALNIMRADPEALLVCGHLEESVHMRLALEKVKWHPKAYFATVGPALVEYHDRLGDRSHLAFSASQFEPRANIQFEPFDRFVTAFKDAYGVEPAYQSAAAYAAGMLLSSAISRAGSFNREAIREALLAMDTTTLIGRYGVDATGLQVKHSPLIVQWQDGSKEIVWPAEVQTAEPVLYSKQTRDGS